MVGNSCAGLPLSPTDFDATIPNPTRTRPKTSTLHLLRFLAAIHSAFVISSSPPRALAAPREITPSSRIHIALATSASARK